MFKLFLLFLKDIVSDSTDSLNQLVGNITELIFYTEKYMNNMVNFHFIPIDEVSNYFIILGVFFILLKFLRKALSQYVLYTEGDPDSDPFILITNFTKALAIAVSFDMIYGYIVKLTNEVLSDTIGILLLSYDFSLFDFVFSPSVNIVNLVFELIIVVCIFILYLRFIMQGLELLLLRIGLPLACIGLMDADGGIFKPYITKFSQSMFTVIIQISLFCLAIELMNETHYIWSTASLLIALKTPQILSEFLIASTGGGMNGLYYNVQMAKMIKSMLAKG